MYTKLNFVFNKIHFVDKMDFVNNKIALCTQNWILSDKIQFCQNGMAKLSYFDAENVAIGAATLDKAVWLRHGST